MEIKIINGPFSLRRVIFKSKLKIEAKMGFFSLTQLIISND